MTKKLPFDPTSTKFSLETAHCLALASDLAYEQPDKIRAKVKSWGLEQCQTFDVDETQCFVASDGDGPADEVGMIIVSFRGTAGFEDWLTNLNFDMTSGPLDGKVHEGFYDALASVWVQVERTIARFRGNRQKSLWLTGHSLGGALATLATARFRDMDRPVDGLYTFGQPRVGDRTFARNFNFDFKPFMYRFVNNNDVVTRVPPRSMGFSHVGTFRYFKENGKMVNDIGWWNRFLDRMHGRINDLFEWGSDGIKDHSMKHYIKNIEKAMK